MSLAFESFGLFSLMGYGLAYALKSYPLRMYPGCGFYFYLTYSVLTLFVFLFFILVSKKYKLRKRDDIVPYYLFAEGTFEKNYAQEQRYLQEEGYYGSFQTTHASGSSS